MEQTTFAAGCFWKVEEDFMNLPGVIKTRVGYTGGVITNPSYNMVCTGRTGHAEAVLVQYDPELISYETLLNAFWACHNPTTLNCQGADHGTQYRSAIFYHTEEQKKSAEASKIAHANTGELTEVIVTEIMPASIFYPAEEYHQKYLEKRRKKS